MFVWCYRGEEACLQDHNGVIEEKRHVYRIISRGKEEMVYSLQKKQRQSNLSLVVVLTCLRLFYNVRFMMCDTL